jgi:hypothetical protein
MWRNLGDQTKQILFSPDYAANVDRYFAVAEPIQGVLKRLGGQMGEPVRLFQTITSPRDLHVNLLRDVQTHAPAALPAVGDAVAQGLFSQDPAAALKTWDQMGDGTKGILYTPARIAEIGNQLQLRQMQGAVPQAGKSSAGLVGDARSWTRSLLLKMVPGAAYGLYEHSTVGVAKAAAFYMAANAVAGGSKRAMGRLLWNPRAAQMLVEGYQPPRTPWGAAAIGAGAAATLPVPQVTTRPPGYTKGGYLGDLERRTVDRRAVLAQLQRGSERRP